MLRMNRTLIVLTIAVLSGLPQSSAPAQFQNPQHIVERNKIVVKDYPLPELVQRLFRICGKKLEYTEDFPNVKVTLNCVEPDFENTQEPRIFMDATDQRG